MAVEIQAKRFNIYDEKIPFLRRGEKTPAPSVEVFFADKANNTGQAMLAFPGGGYSFRSKLSSSDYGKYFAARGVTTISVEFRLGSDGYDGKAILSDALAAARLAQIHAAEWGFDPKQIGVIGTSAGGHLSAMMATGLAETFLRHTDTAHSLPESFLTWRPEFAIYCYSVLSLLQPLQHTETAQNFLGEHALSPQHQYWSSPLEHLNATHCRSFLWHTAEDTEVEVDHTLNAYRALRAHGVPCELHIYEKGPHALGLAQDLVCSEPLGWAEDAFRWIVNQPVKLTNAQSI